MEHGTGPTGGALPNLIVIGAQKCGTSALHRYMARHPEICMSRKKELDFFIAERNWRRGVEWYRENFDPGVPVRGESSPDYTAHPRFRGVPERMVEVVPDAKLIFMVRDPIERIRSQWIHNYSNRVQRKPLARAVLEDLEYVARSSYHMQLARFCEHYPLERILVIDQEDLLRRRRRTMRTTFEFLGVRMVWRKTFRRKRLETAKRRRRTLLGTASQRVLPVGAWRRVRHRVPFSVDFEQPQLDERTREELASRLADDIARFRGLTGREFAHWSV